jgi:SAM-dependent methyltransferase
MRWRCDIAFALRFRDYVKLYDLARKRLHSPEDYQSFQCFQGELLVRYLKSRGLDVGGQLVLDLGCGRGGYSLALQDGGAQVVGIDRLADDVLKGMKVACADALSLPFESNKFDLVICASLIEHVISPAGLVEELNRVLRVDGVAYLSFPPFYSPVGGHQFSPFHLLGEKLALRIVRARGLYRGNRWLEENYPTSPSSFAEAFGNWGLYPLTIAKVARILRGLPVLVMERSTRWLPIDFSNLPILGEFLTWHVQFLFRKM